MRGRGNGWREDPEVGGSAHKDPLLGSKSLDNAFEL